MPVTTTTTPRICIVNAVGMPLDFELKVNNGIQAGATFWLWESNQASQPLYQFKLITGPNGQARFSSMQVPQLALNKLSNKTLTWQINLCAFVPQVTEGAVELRITQDGISCSVTKETKWEIKAHHNLPACEIGYHLPLRGELKFLLNQSV